MSEQLTLLSRLQLLSEAELRTVLEVALWYLSHPYSKKREMALVERLDMTSDELYLVTSKLGTTLEGGSDE